MKSSSVVQRGAVVCSLVLWVSCGASKAPTDALAAAMLGPSLRVGLDWKAPSELQRDPLGFATLAHPNRSATVHLEASSSAVTVEAVQGGARLKFRPVDGPADFKGWGPARAAADAVVYLSTDGASALVERTGNQGLKEDIVLTRSLGDTVRFSWALELGADLEARLEANGSVGIYAASGVLGEPIQVGDAKTALALAKARAQAPHDALRFRIPAPTVTVADGSQPRGVAHFELGAATTGAVELRLVAEGLEGLAYPLTLDPSVVVTNAADFELGGNLEGNVDVSATALKRSKILGGVGAWAATTALPTARFGHASVAYNGFLYVVGGNGDRSDVLVAPIAANGTVGAFVATSSFATGRSGHTAVAYNGFLYVIGGLNVGTNTALSDVQVAPINLNGTLGAFRATTGFSTGRSAHASVAANGFLYVLGGATAASSYLNDVQVARLAGNGDVGAFTFTTAFTTARSGAVAVTHNGFLYLLGGTNGAPLADVQQAPLTATGPLGAFSPTSTLINPRALHGAAVSGGTLYVTGNGAEVQFAPIYRGGGVGPFGLANPFVTPRDQHGTVAYGGRLYVIGGQNAGTALGDVQVATLGYQGPMTPFTTTSTFGPGNNFARYAHCAAAGNGFLYITGGANGGTYLNDIRYAPIGANGAVGPFVGALATFATARTEHGCFINNGYLYIYGGRSAATTYQSDVQYAGLNADGSVGAFTTTTAMPVGRSSMSTAVYVNTGINAYLYVMGGYGMTGYLTDVQKASINLVNGSLGAFSATTSLPGPRTGGAAAIYNGSLYVVGGGAVIASVSTFYNDVQVAPIDINSGNLGAFTATSTFTTGRNGLNAVAYNGMLYVIGGNSIVSPYLSDVQAAPILSGGGVGAFTQVGSLPLGEYTPSSVVNNGYLYVTGGLNGGSNFSNNVWLSTLDSTGTVGAFGDVAPMPTGIFYADLQTNNGYLYVVGGYIAGVGQTTVQYATINPNGTLGALTTTTPFTGARFAHATALYNNVLYVIGGFSGGAQLADIQYAHLNANGSVGAFTATTSLPVARSGLSAVAYNGRLYAIGGSNTNVPTGDVVSAPINADGSLGAFTTAPAVVPARYSHASTVYGTNLYIAGGYTGAVSLSDIQVVPINADGSLGAAAATSPLPSTRQPTHTMSAADGYLYLAGGGTSAVTIAPINANGTLGNVAVKSSLPAVLPAGSTALVANGYLYVVGNNSSSGSTTTIQMAPVKVPAARGSYSKLIDLQNQSNALSVVVNGTASAGVTSLEYRTAPVSGVLGPSTVVGPVTLGASMPLAGANVRYAWLRFTLDDLSQAAAVNLAATNERDLTDFTVSSTAIALAVAPPAVTVAPRQTVAFTSSGGSGTGVVWALSTNGSGGTVNASGSYTAGPTGGRTDVVQATDSLANTATATVTVTAGVSALPATPSVSPHGAINFSASGGSGTGFTWLMVTNGSGGSISAAGAYAAGAVGPATDVVRVTDSLGNVANVSIAVTAALAIAPAAPSVVPSGTVNFTASGGSGAGLGWSILTNQSGGTIGATTGQYHAGTVQGTDVVKVTDSLSNTATVNVTVTNSLAITPNPVSVPPRGAQQFTASGGSGAGFTFAFVTNASGGTLSGAGAYTAGSTASVQDTIRATDSLGNTATALVTVTAALSAMAAPATVPPRGSSVLSATGGSGAGLTWALVTNASGATLTGASYTAGATGGVMDSVQVTDSLGNTAATTITVGAAVSLAPATVTVTPRGSQQLTATGGSGTGYTWSLLTNASMGTVAAGTGLYVAGRTGSVTDVVQVTDSLGNTATRDVAVTAAVSVTPSAPAVAPHASLLLMASGGSNAGYSWFFAANRSGATVSANSGLYQAGGTADVVDQVQVVDSIGNIGTVDITVGAPLAIVPAMPTVTPRQMVAFTATGGAGQNRWALSSNGSGGSIDVSTGAYVAGPVGSTTDTVSVTDMLNNVATTVVTVSGALAVTPSTASVPPLGTWQFTAMGGSDGGYSFTVSTNRSGATIDGATGAYHAGATSHVTDTVTVSDGLATATATVEVGDGVTISPSMASVGVDEHQMFTAVGGSGEGYQWSLASNGSGASIDASSGEYVAGATGNTSDDVVATDSLGNTATARVTVVGGGAGGSTTPPSQRPPLNGFACGCGQGSGGLTSALLGLLVLVGRRKRLAVGAVVALALAVVPMASAAPKKASKASAPTVEPAPPPAPSPAPVEPPPPPRPAVFVKSQMAVLDVEITVPDLKLDATAFTDIVVTAVEQTENFKVLSSNDIKTMLGVERQRQLMGCSDDSACAVELANALGSRFVFSANVGRVGDTFVVTTKLIDATRSAVVGRASVQTTSANALLETMWRSAQQTLEAYGGTLTSADAAAWAARPKPTPPATVVMADETPSMFGAVASGTLAFQPLSVTGKRGTVGAEVDFSWRRKRLEVLVGVVVATSPGARLTGLFAIIDSRFRLDVGLRVSLFPALGPVFGGGPTVGAEFALTPHWFVQARGAFEAYPVGGGVVLAMIGGAGVAARF